MNDRRHTKSLPGVIPGRAHERANPQSIFIKCGSMAGAVPLPGIREYGFRLSRAVKLAQTAKACLRALGRNDTDFFRATVSGRGAR
jgi:hypothetical protein